VVSALRPEPAPKIPALVVAVDGSVLARRAVAVANRLAQRLQAAVHLVSVVRTTDDVRARRRELANIDVAGSVKRMILVDADPTATILAAVDRLPGAVACLATHGRGRSAACLGSVATAMLARSRDPVVLTCPLVEPTVGEGVLACVDDGPDAAGVIDAAVRWGELLGEPVTAVTVAEAAAGPGCGRPARRFGPGGDVDAFLDGVVRPARADGHRIETLALFDPVSPSAGLYRRLQDRPAALVVAGSGAGTGPAHRVFGTAAGSLVRHSPSPVLVVPGRWAPLTPVDEACASA
jgi:nucleotide-binding universal stress UspA family protein